MIKESEALLSTQVMVQQSAWMGLDVEPDGMGRATKFSGFA
jgi:hypothetical protein